MGVGKRLHGGEARKMILVRNLRLGIDEPVDKLKRLAAKEIGVPERDILSLKITKKSLDARRKTIYIGCMPWRSS